MSDFHDDHLTRRAPGYSLVQRLREAFQAWPRAALGNVLAKLLIVALGLLITVYVARLGPAVQGVFALFVAVESALLTLFSGLGLWLARQVSQQQSQYQQPVRALLLNVLQWAVGLGLLVGLLLFGLSLQTKSQPFNQLWLLALAAPFLLLVPTATGLWLGQSRMWPLNVAQVAAPAAVLAGLAGVVWLTEDLLSNTSVALLVLMAWVSGKSLVAVLVAVFALHDAARCDKQSGHESGFQVPSYPKWWRDSSFVLTIGLTNVISLLNYRASLFLVEHFIGLPAVGTYSVAVTVAELLWLLSSAITVSLYARIGHPDRQQAAAMTVRAVRINVITTLLAAPFLLLGAWWGLPWAMGEAYVASLWPLVCLLPGVAAYAAASSLSAFYTNHLGKPHLSGGIAGLSLLISVTLGWWLVPLWGTVGAALATSLGYVAAIAVAYAVFLRHAGLTFRELWRAPSDNTTHA